MEIRFVLLPLFVQVLLTFVILGLMAGRRRRALAGGSVRGRDIALRQPNWPDDATQAANSFSNQFELPVLLYVLTILSIMTKHADFIFVVLAWIFVLSRIAQAYVHVTSNVVKIRSTFYGVGVLALAIAWIIFIVRIVLGLP